MLKTGISFLLVVLVAMQSVMAMADEHLEHSSEPEHSVIGLQGHSFDAPSIPLESESQGYQLDCHHCHGNIHCYVISHISYLQVDFQSQYFTENTSNYHLLQLSPDLRPPIV